MRAENEAASLSGDLDSTRKSAAEQKAAVSEEARVETAALAAAAANAAMRTEEAFAEAEQLRTELAQQRVNALAQVAAQEREFEARRASAADLAAAERAEALAVQARAFDQRLQALAIEHEHNVTQLETQLRSGHQVSSRAYAASCKSRVLLHR